MRPLLLFPVFFRPNDAGGQIARHFFQRLASDTDVHIVCSDSWEVPKGLESVHLHAISEIKIVSKFDKLLRRIGFRDLYNSPDYFHYSFRKNAMLHASKLIKDKEVDYIHTINNPVSSHLLGLELKKKYGLPWVAQLYDPWFGNPYRVYKTSFFRRLDKRRESETAQLADVLIFPNVELLDSWIDTYGEAIRYKSVILPFATDIPLIKTSDSVSETVTISHIGTLSSERRADAFIYGVSQFRLKYPDLAKKLRVNIVGYMTLEDVQLISDLQLQDIFNIVGPVSEEECADYYEKSDAFLIIDINCQPNLFYPSKLVKYFCYKKPILGLTKEDSVVAHELIKTRNYVCQYNDTAGVVSFLEKMTKDKNLVQTNDQEYYKNFLTPNVISKYKSIINSFIRYE